MTLLEQCQRWNKNDEFQKIIDAWKKYRLRSARRRRIRSWPELTTI